MQQAHDAAWTRLVGPALRGPEHFVLVAVRRHPGIEQGALAALVSLQRSTMADVGRRLERRGLLARRTNPFDARSKLLELTVQGETVLRDVATRLSALDAALLDGDEDPTTLLRRLEALADRWDLLGLPVAVPDPPHVDVELLHGDLRITHPCDVSLDEGQFSRMEREAAPIGAPGPGPSPPA